MDILVEILPLLWVGVPGAGFTIPGTVGVSGQTAVSARLPVHVTAVESQVGHARNWAHVELLLWRSRGRDRRREVIGHREAAAGLVHQRGISAALALSSGVEFRVPDAAAGFIQWLTHTLLHVHCCVQAKTASFRNFFSVIDVFYQSVVVMNYGYKKK